MLGKNLRQLRMRANFSQEHIARALNLTRPSYVSIETGAREATLEEQRKISELFGVTLADLLSDNLTVSDSFEVEAVDNVDKTKYKHVLLYILNKVGAFPNIGETAIYKLLYFAETNHLVKYGRPILSETFYKYPYGPVPANFKTVTNSMIANNELDVTSGSYFMYKQQKFLPRVKYTASALNDEELSTIKTVLSRLADMTATQLSDLSHMDLPWINGVLGKPVDLTLASQREKKFADIIGSEI